MNACVNDLGQPVGHPLGNWTAAKPVEPVVLDGRFAKLVHVDPQIHSRALFDAFSLDTEGRNWTYLPIDPITEFEPFCAWMDQIAESKDPFFFTIIEKKTERPVGIASFLRIDPQMGSIEVGYIHFSLLMQKTPIATDAMFLMMRHAFEDLGYRRYEWKCDSLNTPSRRAAERLGFTYEGTFRQAVHYKGRNRDTAWFSIIDSEWSLRKKAFETWLSADNFQSSGQQIKTLHSLTNG